MIDLDDVPGPPVPSRRAQADKQLLREVVTRASAPSEARTSRAGPRRGPAAPSPTAGGRPDVVEWVIGALSPTSPPPGGPGNERRPRRPRAPVLAFAAVVTVVAVVVSVAAIVHGPSARVGSGFARTTPAPRPALPSGWQRVSSLGIEVDAPGSWPINSWAGCSDPPPAALIVREPGFLLACLRGPGSPTVNSTVQIRRVGEEVENLVPPVGSTPPASRLQVTRNGLAATVSTYARPAGRTETVVSFTARDVEVTVASSDALLMRRIVASVWPVTVDSVGCTTDLPPSPSWNRRRTGPAVHLGRPSSIAVCYYPGSGGAGRQVLGASTLLTGAAARTAAATIDSAQAGTVPDSAGCTPDAFDDRVVLHVHRADGTTVEAWVKTDGCTDRWVATATGISQSTRAQAEVLLGPLHTGYGTGGGLPDR